MINLHMKHSLYQYLCFSAQSITLLFTNPLLSKRSFSKRLSQVQSGSSQYSRVRMYSKYLLNYSELEGRYTAGLSREGQLALRSSFLLWRGQCFSLLQQCPRGDCPLGSRLTYSPNFQDRLSFQLLYSRMLTLFGMDKDASEPRIALDDLPFILKLKMMVVRIEVFLATSKVNHENLILFLSKSNQKVSRLDIIVDQSFGVNPFDPFQDLISNQQDSFECECSLTVLEQLFKRRTIDICHKGAVIILDSVPIKIRNASASFDYSIKLGLSLKRRVLHVYLLQLYRDFLLRREFISKIRLALLAEADSCRGGVFLIERKLQFLH